MEKIRGLNELPALVSSWLLVNDAWLVGSACEWLLDVNQAHRPKDFDVMIPPEQFHKACKLLTGMDFKLNSFGGLKVLSDDIIDVWPMTLADYVLTLSGTVAVHLRPFKVVRW